MGESTSSSLDQLHDEVSSVLSFYSSQITSHTGLIIGFVLAFFTLVQTRQSAANAGLPEWLYHVGAVSVLSAAIYSMFRIVLYGSLSGVLMNCDLNSFKIFFEDPEVNVSSLTKHAQVNSFASYLLVSWTPARGWIYKRRGAYSPWAKRRVEFWIQLPAIFSMMAGIVVVGLAFGWPIPEWLLFVGVPAFATIVIDALVSLRTASPSLTKMRS